MGIWFGVREQLLQRKLTEKLLKSHFFLQVWTIKMFSFDSIILGARGKMPWVPHWKQDPDFFFCLEYAKKVIKKRNNNNKIIELTARVRAIQWTSDQFTRFNGLENTLEFLISVLITQTKVWWIKHAIFKGHSRWLHIISLATCRDKIYLWLCSVLMLLPYQLFIMWQWVLLIDSAQ